MYYIQGKARRNSRTYGKLISKHETLEELMGALTGEEIAGATKPYIFSYIQLPNERVITQNVLVGGSEIPVSPQKAWEAISAQA